MSERLRGFSSNITFYGAVAQLVERMDGIHEVTGSTPVSSTNNFDARQLVVLVNKVHETALNVLF